MKFSNKLIITLTSVCIACSFGCSDPNRNNDSSIIDYVDPFIGTDDHGHTFPGATVPFGMVQLSPDTRTLGWDACAGYHYSDSSILGFSHTHLSGTGIGDYGDILFMPFTGEVPVTAGEAEFTKTSEEATPGYYRVELSDYDILVELTATQRAGLHRYTFQKGGKAGIMIDLTHTIHGHNNPLHEIRIINDSEIRGLKVTSGWAKKHDVYFTAKFSKPFEAELFLGEELQEDVSEITGTDARVRLNFKTEAGEQLLAKVGISPVSYQGSVNNLNLEVNGWDFDYIREKAALAWEEQLSKINITTDDIEEKRSFYTALYHASLAPTIYSDVDGSYRGMDREIHNSEDPNYTVFSLWDTHRALHPLFTLMDPGFNQTLIRDLLRKYDEGGILPMWELASNYTGTMIGSHAVSVIVDAYMKGQRDFDTAKALEAVIHAVAWDTTIRNRYSDLESWANLMPEAKHYEERYGFIPCDLESASVSKALEFAYNYWAIATMAKDMGEEEIAKTFFEKAARYQIYFDEEVGFMRGKRLDGSWDEPFNPRYSAHWKSPYVEGNAWQWSWYVPHDVDGLIGLMGGEDAFALKLDSLFTITSEVLGEEKSADITGLIGQYAHGNEPSHHIAYLFNEVNRPWRTQEVVSEILDKFYTDRPDGLCGNEDCGQMSAWYILSSIGIYPVCPGDTRYSIGRPSFDKVDIELPGGKLFTVIAKNRSEATPYVEEVFLDGKKLTEPYIDHATIAEGATLTFIMGAEKGVFWD
ncbi:MAG: GH92 family glycosyl hydrolase [Bacteroidota bacterium]